MARKASSRSIKVTLLYKRLFAYAWHYKMHFALFIVLTAILASSNSLFLALSKKVTVEDASVLLLFVIHLCKIIETGSYQPLRLKAVITAGFTISSFKVTDVTQMV